MPKGTKGFQKGHKVNIGRIVSDKTKRRISVANTGKERTEEARRNYSVSGKAKNKKYTDEEKRKISETAKRLGYGKWMTGRKVPEYVKEKISKKAIERYDRIGRKQSINLAIRGRTEYKLWRKAVFERDNYTCIWCGQHGGKLNADHIKPFAVFPELRFAIDNGRTLCVSCHGKTETFRLNLVGMKKLYNLF